MAQKIMQRDGIAGFYRGFVPNALKNLPNKGAALTCPAEATFPHWQSNLSI